MCFETIKVAMFACDLPAPCFALIQTRAGNTDVVADSYGIRINAVNVIRILCYEYLCEVFKERLKLRRDAMKSAIISRVS